MMEQSSLNCGTEVLCVMLIYDVAELTRIVNKVLGKNCCLLLDSVVNNHVHSTEPVKFSFLFLGLGIEETQKWIDTDIVGCLQSFFIECQKGDWLKDPEVLFMEYRMGDHRMNMPGLKKLFCFCPNLPPMRNSLWIAPHQCNR